MTPVPGSRAWRDATVGDPMALFGDKSRANRIGRFEGIGEITFDLCTISGNTLLAGEVFAGEANLRLSRSIVWEPGTLLWAMTGPPATPNHLLLHDISAFPIQPDIFSGDPRFIDAAAGDLRLRADSPALDIAPDLYIRPTDLAGQPRAIDLPGVENLDGPLDLGGYEHAPAGDLIFRNGFESP